MLHTEKSLVSPTSETELEGLQYCSLMVKLSYTRALNEGTSKQALRMAELPTPPYTCQVYLHKKKPHVLSLEQSQKKDERNKGRVHRVIPDKAWRKAGVQCCMGGRNIYLILYFTLKPLSACSHAGELALLGCSQRMKAGCWRSMVRV